MLVDITQALRAPGISFEFDVSEEFEPMCASGEEIRFTKPVSVSGSYVFTGEITFLHGVVSADYSALCCRCLKDVQASMSLPFSEEFGKVEDDGHPDRYLYKGEKLDLGQMVGDLISLNAPMRHLCKEDCRGLCPVCGVDRNIADCHCAGTDLN